MLQKFGVPYDVAWSLDPEDVLAQLVIFGESEGNVFDWRELRWEERKG